MRKKNLALWPVISDPVRHAFSRDGTTNMQKLIYTYKRLILRTIWSLHGLRATWASEHSFRTWVWANLASATLACVLDLTAAERGLILALGLLILAAELINTAIEDAVDYISTDNHPLAKRAKDAGSAGVFVTSVAAGVAWVVVLIG
ncbi:diacylglycerol kinase [Celeribacter sp.]|uniref:diacylglycerol kinase n=1 Tax=Celeribacter sp. TaxID=1890673 RepID=UPI003A8D8700